VTRADISLEALLSCPVPSGRPEHVLLGHGSGGRLSAELLREVFLPAFDDPVLRALEDQATLTLPDGARFAMTTDSFVVKPIFFPGGDIGKLAICGTVNDLAVGGAVPQFIAAAFILEEGLPLSELRRVVASMRQTCSDAGVALVTGDTKVVDRGKGDRIFITTTGVGSVPAGRSLSIANARAGDYVMVSGTMGDHGVAVMSVREGLDFETSLTSDTAPLNHLAEALIGACPAIRCMRDPTRGGLATTLNELAEASRVGIEIDEAKVPVRPEVQGACEILGLDPLYVANEGKLVAVVPESGIQAALEAARRHPSGADAAVIGRVVDEHRGAVVVRTRIGGSRRLATLEGELLPRIC